MFGDVIQSVEEWNEWNVRVQEWEDALLKIMCGVDITRHITSNNAALLRQQQTSDGSAKAVRQLEEHPQPKDSLRRISKETDIRSFQQVRR